MKEMEKKKGEDQAAEAPVISNKKVILKHFVKGCVTESDMEVVVSKRILKVLRESLTINVNGCGLSGVGALVVKNLYLSCDPYMRTRMSAYGPTSYMESFIPGMPIVGYGVAEVLDSTYPRFRKGDLVWGVTGWEEYSLITSPSTFFKISDTDMPLSYYTGILGMPGLAAYAGFYEVCSPKKGDRVFVSSAFSAVGQLVGQFAKSLGCYVVGSTSTNEKVDLLKSKYGFDEAINYKEEQNNLDGALRRCFPEGIDIYFDNVGGEILDAVLVNMRVHGRIALCGMISEYNNKEGVLRGSRNLMCMITKRIRMEGFIVYEYLQLYPKYLDMILPLIRQGKMNYTEDVSVGLDSGPSALLEMCSGQSLGKRVVMVE